MFHSHWEGMARVTRLELAASGVTGRRSNQLSYTRMVCGAVYISGGTVWQGLFYKKMNRVNWGDVFWQKIAVYQSVTGEICVADFAVSWTRRQGELSGYRPTRNGCVLACMNGVPFSVKICCIFEGQRQSRFVWSQRLSWLATGWGREQGVGI